MAGKMKTRTSQAGRIKASPKKTSPGRAKAQGFTLLELVVVLVIVSLLSALIAPRLTGPMGKLDLKTAARKISASLQYARSQAAAEKTIYVAMFDLDGNSMIIIHSPLNMNDFITSNRETIAGALTEAVEKKEARSGGLKMYRPPEGVALTRGVSKAGDYNEGLFPVFFFPGGGSSGGRITLVNQQGRQYTITVDFITGAVQLSEVV